MNRQKKKKAEAETWSTRLQSEDSTRQKNANKQPAVPINSATGRVNKTNVKKKKTRTKKWKKKNNGGDKVTTSILYLFLETIRKVENVNEENQKKKRRKLL